MLLSNRVLRSLAMVMVASAVLISLGVACDSENGNEPTVSRSSATPVPFDFSPEFIRQLVDRLRDAEAKGQIPEGESSIFTGNISREPRPAGSGYVSKKSGDELEAVIYPTGETLVVKNASAVEIT